MAPDWAFVQNNDEQRNRYDDPGFDLYAGAVNPDRPSTVAVRCGAINFSSSR
jgi:hypothetical protein